MGDWRQVKLGDIAESITVGYVGPMASQYEPAGIPFLRSQNVLPHRLDLTDVKYIGSDFHAKLQKSALRSGDVVTVRTGKPGATAVVPDHWSAGNCADLVITRPGRLIDPRWLSYYINSAAAGFISSQLVGAVQQHFNIGSAREMLLLLPPLHEQRAIAEVLGALDNKIAGNARTLRLLLEHLSAEFEMTLVAGSRPLRLSAVSEFHNRKRIPLSSRQREQRPGSIPYYGASGIFGRVDHALFDDQLVLVGEDGSVVTDSGTPVIQYIWGPAWVNNHAHVLSGTAISTELLYFAIARKNVTSLVTGAVQPKISMGNLKSLVLDLPQEEELPRLESLVATEMGLWRALREENARLTTTRDALLPRLMSGKIRVKDAEKTVEEVL